MVCHLTPADSDFVPQNLQQHQRFDGTILTDAPGGHDEVVVRRHAPCGFDDLGFIIRDHFDTLEGDAEREAEAGEVSGIGINRLAPKNFVAYYQAGGGVDFALLLLGGWWWWGV